jgi:hypothetical protein
VLFPSWHRAYLYRLEKALQSIPGCADVMLPFWDECSTDSQQNGIPRALTDETFVLDGQTIPNPLRSFVLPVAIVDKVDPNLYSKPADTRPCAIPSPAWSARRRTGTRRRRTMHSSPATADPHDLNGNVTPG